MAKDHTFDFLENEAEPLVDTSLDQDLDAIFSEWDMDFSSDVKTGSACAEEKDNFTSEPSESKILKDDFKLSPPPIWTPNTDFSSDEEEKPVAKKKKKSKRKKSTLNIILLLIALLLIGGIAGILLMNTNPDPYNNRILDNVSVAGVDVGAMTKEDALAAVKSAVGTSYFDTAMIVTLGKTQVILAPANTHANLNASQAVELAYALGRSGTAAECQKTYRISQTSEIVLDITNALNLDVTYIRSTLEAAVAQIGTEFVPSGYSLVGEMPSLDADNYDPAFSCQTLELTLGQPASLIDVDTLYNKVLEAYSQRNFQLVIPGEEVARYPEDLDLNEIYEEICIAPVEAKVDSVTKEVTPGSCGYAFSLDDALELLDVADYGEVISIPMEYVLPAKLDPSGTFTETICTYSTVLSNNEAYNTNMKRVCETINGTVIEPGKVFSMYSVVGDRTSSKGYQNAVCHAGYCIDEEIGGGTDQVASTLYVAALLADLTVTEKYPADHVCSYTTKGTEITMAGSWRDLKFRNDFNTPVKIRAKVTPTQVTIQILGQKALDYTIALETNDSSPISAGSTTVSKKASSGYTDNQVLVEGADGGQVILNIIKNNKETGQEISRKSEYVLLQPANKVIVSIEK